MKMTNHSMYIVFIAHIYLSSGSLLPISANNFFVLGLDFKCSSFEKYNNNYLNESQTNFSKTIQLNVFPSS